MTAPTTYRRCGYHNATGSAESRRRPTKRMRRKCRVTRWRFVCIPGREWPGRIARTRRKECHCEPVRTLAWQSPPGKATSFRRPAGDSLASPAGNGRGESPAPGEKSVIASQCAHWRGNPPGQSDILPVTRRRFVCIPGREWPGIKVATSVCTGCSSMPPACCDIIFRISSSPHIKKADTQMGICFFW